MLPVRRTLPLLAAAASLSVPAAATALSSAQSHVYSSSRSDWAHSQCLDAAAQPPAWRRIGSELLAVHPAPASFRATSRRLEQLAGLPETSETKAQMDEFTRLVKQIDHFYGYRHAPSC